MKLFICLFALAASAKSESNGDLLKASNEQFTADMFQKVVKSKPGENVVISAFSVLSPLAQLALASVGESHDEILKAISLPNDNVTKEVFLGVTQQLRSIKGVELKLANRIYIRNGEKLNEQYAVVSRDVFNSDVKNVDFTKSADAAREINTWVEDNTNHRIKDLISPNSLSANTAAVLVNAIYFKGKWKKPFPPMDTKNFPFHVSKDKQISIPMMRLTSDFKYGESQELDAKLLELPYEGDQSSLLVVLPNQIEGINTLVENLKNPSVLTKAVDDMYIHEVRVLFPKYKIETTTPLGKVLQEMGIVKIFTAGQARLDNLIQGSSDLYISDAIQKAYIDVNEEGAEAAAANAFTALGSAYDPNRVRPKDFNMDKPFYFALKINNQVAFNGIFLQ